MQGEDSKEVCQEDEPDDFAAKGADVGADDDQSDEQSSEPDSASSDGEPVRGEEAEGSASYQGEYEESVASASYDCASDFDQDHTSDFDQDYASDFDQDSVSSYDSDY